jgi:oligopeptide transport system ATP-binding protein
MNGQTELLLEARHLSMTFPVRSGTVQAVSDVSLQVHKGETLGLVGESGCGKSTLGRLLMRLLSPVSGEVLFDGKNIAIMDPRELHAMRRRMQIIFQDPYASLNPRMTLGEIIEEPLKTHHVGKNRTERREIVQHLMERVGIRPEFFGRYPHQFSGGQRQRIGIARALALEPEMIVCDEPVSALDVSIQAQILNLLHDLQKDYHLTYLFISHDLSVVRFIADRVCVMFLGKICEIGNVEEIFIHPRHPYTHYLLQSIPLPDPTRRDEDRQLLTGEIPSPLHPPSGCRFRTRCPKAQEACGLQEPPLQGEDGHCTACYYPMAD